MHSIKQVYWEGLSIENRFLEGGLLGCLLISFIVYLSIML